MALRLGLAGGALTGSLVYYAFRLDVKEQSEEMERKLDKMTRGLRSASQADITRPTPSATPQGYHQPPPLNSDEGWNGMLRSLAGRLVDTTRLTDSFTVPFTLAEVKSTLKTVFGVNKKPSQPPSPSPPSAGDDAA